MAQDMLIARQMGPAKGVDESEHPGAGTVAEAFNIDTSQDTWRKRPGLNPVSISPGSFSGRPRLFAEYVPDYKYEGSHHPALLVGLGYDTALTETLRCYATSTTLTGHAQSAAQEYTCVQGIWKFTTGMRSRYTTALLITNGVDPPFIYHQTSGSGAVQPLNAVEGSNPTGISYLTSPPKGRCVVIYKDRTFMGNIGGESGNRLYWTGPDDALVWPLNVWPSNYNMDVGGSEEVTALRVFREYLVIFKEQSVWVLSGEGVGGAWTVEKISSAHEGALGPRCVCEIEGRLVFFNSLGVYTWGGGSIKTISHPRLEKTWPKLNWNKTSSMSASTMTDKYYQCLHESRTHQVYITVGRLPNVNDTMLVWNYENDTWNIWGNFWENIWPQGSTAGKADYLLRFTQLGAEIKQFNAEGTSVFFLGATSYLYYFDLYQREYYHPISFRILTHPCGDSSFVRVACGFKIDAKKTGNWNLIALLLGDGESVASALIRNSSISNYIIDAVNNAEHDTDGASSFTTAAAGPVDIWHVPTMELLSDSRALTTSTSSVHIKFTTSLDTSTAAIPMIGNILVLPEDTTPIRTHLMYDSGASLWDAALLDTARLVPPRYGSIDFRTNCTGRTFRLLITNAGVSEGNATPLDLIISKGAMDSDIKGWEIYGYDTGTRRGGG